MSSFEVLQNSDNVTTKENQKFSSLKDEPVYKQRDILKNAIQKANDLVAQLDDIPNKLKPALRLYFFNNIIERKGQDPDNGYNKEIQDGIERFKVFIDHEKSAERGKVLPPIGIEIEIPDTFKEFTVEDYDLFYATEDLGIPAGKDIRYEFAPQYSFSAKSQSMLVHELIRGGFIETVDKNGKKKIRGEGDFPLHINLGFPAHLINKENKTKFKKSADVLVNALTYAFSSPERLKKRIDTSRFKLQLAETPDNFEQKLSFSNEIGKWQRLEIRSLEVRDATVYRLLSEAQLLGTALFSSFENLKIKRSYQVVLEHIWQKFEKDVNCIIKEYHIDNNDIDDSKLKSRLILKYTNLSKKFRNLITETSLSIKQVLENSLENSAVKSAA